MNYRKEQILAVKQWYCDRYLLKIVEKDFGSVYKGIHTQSNEEFAIKVSLSQFLTLKNEEKIYKVRLFQYNVLFVLL